jgi:hypothetical protein
MTLVNRRFKITSKRHPHYNESGDYRGQQVNVTGEMILHLVNCAHGTQRCAVRKNEIEEANI